MRLALCSALSLLAACATVPSAAVVQNNTAEHSDRIAMLLGVRALGKDDFEPVEKQGTIGFEFSHEKPDAAIGFEVGLQLSGDEDDNGGLDTEAGTGELYAGVRKSFGDESVHPYIGGGIALIAAEVEANGSDDDDVSGAAYAHAGVAFDLAENFFIGLDARVLFGSDLELGGVDTDADYGQLAFVIGFAL